jgi:MFS family permease
MLLAPLLPFVRDDFDVSYTEIGFALAAFNLTSAAVQTPAGFLVDRLGARVLLAAGLLIESIAFITAGLVPSFWIFIAMFALAGVGNTVFHPADYALLARHTPAQHIGQSFSVHTFAGMLGSAVAPPILLFMHYAWDWRGAFVVSGLLGLGIAALVATMPDGPPATASKSLDAEAKKPDWHVLVSTPILLNLLFFMLLAIISMGLYNYSAVALNALHGLPLAMANAALTGFLLASSIGVLAGGLLVGRTNRHALVAGAGLAATAAFLVLIAIADLGDVGQIAAMSLAGFFSGLIMPSRDMIVRAATPEGAFGRVFGFVTNGFNLGGILAPLLLGPIMDQGSPRWVFLALAGLAGLAIATVTSRSR